MNGSILYIVTTNVTERPIISGTTESELKSLYESLAALSAEQNGGLEILDTQRCVINASGKVIYTRVWLSFDQYGLEIHDVYRCLLDSYSAPERKPEPELKLFHVKRYETWENDYYVKARSAEEAMTIASDEFDDGHFDVLEGYCIDADTTVEEVAEQKGESK